MRTRAGMTLLEVIVALAVAGAALVAGTSVLGFLADQQGREGAQAIAIASAVRHQLREWIASARLATEGDAIFSGADELTFVTSAPTDVSTGGTRVHIYIERSDTAHVHGLVASLTPWRTRGATMYVTLASDAETLHARYLPTTDAPRWERKWESTSVLPAGVELQIGFIGNADAAHDLLSAPMRISLNARR